MEAILAVAAVAALVWGLAYVLRGSLVHGCLAFLVVGFCFGHEFLRFEVGPFPLSLDRLLLGGLVLVYVVHRCLGRADPKPVQWRDVAMLLLAVVLVYSTFSHNWELDVPRKVSPIWRLVAGFLMPMAVYWIARQSPIDKRTVLTVYAVLTVLGIYLAITALAEVTQQWWLVFPPHIADPRVGIHFGRARGPTLQSQSLGLHLDACLLCVWMWRRHLGRAGQLALMPLIPLFLAAVVVTYTRCVWIGAVLAATAVLGLPMPRRWRAAVAGPALIAAMVVVLFQWDRLVHLERPAGAEASRSSVDTRRSFMYVSWRMFLDRPLFGLGYGQFQQASRDYLADRTTDMDLEAIRGQPNHNMFLALLTETGLIGAGLFTAMLAGWAIHAWRTWQDASAPDWVRGQGLMMLGMLGIYLGPAMFFDLTFSPHDQWLTFFLAGLTAALPASAARSGGRPALCDC